MAKLKVGTRSPGGPLIFFSHEDLSFLGRQDPTLLQDEVFRRALAETQRNPEPVANPHLQRRLRELGLLEVAVDLGLKSSVSVARIRGSVGKGVNVPRLGEVALWFICPRKQREGVLGDLEEDFRKCCRDHGLRTAQVWYWWQVIRTAAANTSAFALKATMVETVLRKLGL